MGCGSSAATAVVTPAKDSLNPNSYDNNLQKTSIPPRNGSGRSVDSGFGDNGTYVAGQRAVLPPIKSSAKVTATTVPVTSKTLNTRTLAEKEEDERAVLMKLRAEGLIQRSMTMTNFGASFEVVEDGDAFKTKRKLPARLAKLERESFKRKAVTDEQIQAKLEKAKKRKKAQEEMKLARIRQVSMIASADVTDQRNVDEKENHISRSDKTGVLLVGNNDKQPIGYSKTLSEQTGYDKKNNFVGYHRNNFDAKQNENKRFSEETKLNETEASDWRSAQNNTTYQVTSQVTPQATIGHYADDDDHATEDDFSAYAAASIKDLLARSQRLVKDIRQIEEPQPEKTEEPQPEKTEAIAADYERQNSRLLNHRVRFDETVRKHSNVSYRSDTSSESSRDGIERPLSNLSRESSDDSDNNAKDFWN